MIFANGSGMFFDYLADFARQLSPVLTIVVLVLLGIALWEIIKLIKGLDVTILKLNSTIDEVDKSLEKLQAPLDTVESLSYTVDSVHAFTKRSVEKSVDMITDNFNVVKDWATSLFTKDKHHDDVIVEEEIGIEITE